MTKHPVLVAGAMLTLFAIAGSSLVALTHEQTKERIAANEKLALLRNLQAVVPPQLVDNDMVTDTLLAHDPELLGAESTLVYRGRLGGQPVAAVLTPIVPDGYSGPIKLLVAVRRDGTLSGVRVISHKETPGLGDKIETKKSDWILGFSGKSLNDPQVERWQVKRDGGDFDQFTGATITPRAIVRAVKKTLQFVQQKGEQLYAAPQSSHPAEGDA